MIEGGRLTDEALTAYDTMMVECAMKVEKFAPLAVSIWSDVLRELDKRGFVKLISGSYDDVGNALIQRVREYPKA